MKKPTQQALEAVRRGRDAADKRDGRMRILFVCLGNICRSPAAEGIARRMADDAGISGRFEFDSAGFYGGHAGDLPDPRMRSAAWQRGYRLEHHSRTIKSFDFDDFDLIVGMDDQNIRNLHDAAPSTDDEEKIIRMSDLATGFPDADSVPDPYWEGADGFRLVLDLLEDAVSVLLKEAI